MPRLSDIEKLARDICWAENCLDHKNARATKASFWSSLDADVQTEYVGWAEWLVFIVKKLKPIRILSLVDFKLPKAGKIDGRLAALSTPPLSTRRRK